MMNFAIFVIVYLFGTSVYGQDANSIDFRGEIVFEKYLKIHSDDPFNVPEKLFDLEKLDTITYYILSDSVVYSKVVDMDGRVSKYKRKTKDVEEVFDVRNMSVSNITSGYKLASDIKYRFRKDKEVKNINGVRCRKYFYSTNKDDEGFVYLAKDFPYVIYLNDDVKSISIPMFNDRLNAESEITSKITETLRWTRYNRMIGFTYDPDLNIDYIVELFK